MNQLIEKRSRGSDRVSTEFIRRYLMLFLASIILLLACNLVCAATIDKPSTVRTADESKAEFQTLLFSTTTRDKIDKQREAYLYPDSEKGTVQATLKGIEKDRVKTKVAPPSPQRLTVNQQTSSPKVEVSVVLIRPDGTTLVRENDRYSSASSDREVTANPQIKTVINEGALPSH